MHHQLIERQSHQTFDKNKKLSIFTVSKIINNLAFMLLEGTFLAPKILLLCPKNAFICIVISLELQSKDFKSGCLFLITVFVVAICPTTQLNSSAQHAAHQFS